MNLVLLVLEYRRDGSSVFNICKRQKFVARATSGVEVIEQTLPQPVPVRKGQYVGFHSVAYADKMILVHHRS